MKNNITIFLLCRAVSQIGDDMQDTVIPILILEMTKSSKSFASFIGFQDLFMLLVVIFVGYITDIYDRRKNMIICDFINGSITLFFLIFFKKNFYYILIFQLSQMFFSKFFLASSSSLLVEIVPKDELLKTTSKLNFYNTSISTLAPAIALFIYSRLGIRPILIINVLSYFISGFFECFITYEHKKVEKIENIVTSYFSLFKHLKEKKTVLYLVAFALAINTFLNPISTIIFPYIINIKLKLSAEYIGYYYLCFSIGLILGNLFIQKFPKINLYKYIFLNGILEIFSLFFTVILFAFFSNTYFFMSIIAFSSMLGGFINILLTTPTFAYMRLSIDKTYLGKFGSFFNIAALGLTPLAFYITGILIAKFNAITISILLLSMLLLIYMIFYIKGIRFKIESIKDY